MEKTGGVITILLVMEINAQAISPAGSQELGKLTDAFGEADAATDSALNCDAMDEVNTKVINTIAPPKSCEATSKAWEEIHEMLRDASSACWKTMEDLDAQDKDEQLCKGIVIGEPWPERVHAAGEAKDRFREKWKGENPAREELLSWEYKRPECELEAIMLAQYYRRALAIYTKMWGRVDKIEDGICVSDLKERTEARQQIHKIRWRR